MASMYSAKVMEHFANPHNVGEIPDANGVGEVGNPKCGDIMRMYLKIENNVIVDVKFLTFGCGAAIATSSMATDLIKGKTIDEALKLTNKAVAGADQQQGRIVLRDQREARQTQMTFLFRKELQISFTQFVTTHVLQKNLPP